jgi:hypothetical protein
MSATLDRKQRTKSQGIKRETHLQVKQPVRTLGFETGEVFVFMALGLVGLTSLQ